MNKTEYLYELKPTDFDDKNYWDVLAMKLDAGMQLFRSLYTSGQDDERLFYVNKAIEHTRGLLNEREEN